MSGPFSRRVTSPAAELTCRRFITACEELLEQEEDFAAMSKSVESDTLIEWEGGVSNWERDPTKHADPYIRVHDGERCLPHSVMAVITMAI